MATPKFSFSGWNSQSLAPKINPATSNRPSILAPGLVLPPGFRTPGAPAAAPATAAPGLVATTNAANPNLPAWLQDEVAKLNATEALRRTLTGAVTGGAPAAPSFDPNLGIAAVTNARTGFNQQVFGMNEAARLQNLIQQRNQLSPVGGFGFNNPLQVPRQLALDRQIEDYQRINLPISAGGNFRPSGWTNPFRTF